ncbi:Fur family transcriptional regulator, ferric uptake regulator [Pustulibacterium marinum]|uniref:Fur family transcriptional regulator, ferric uptake regulator n=1 Tax=Pustulibacterium marinum TaxID=1224947 RepID=A0A1I7FMY1_9FLAO|nr:transcriptional repressor [Pustulibacterium marinum]SFU37577.1 Fur family transcriptional regulator, ferric uptake regulator [Pustulibacterium marinum]
MALTRNTKAQEEVLKLMQETPHTLTVDEICEKIPLQVNKTTVYRMLERFVAAGKVHFITSSDGKAHYALCTSCKHQHTLHNHIHFQCTACGTVDCLPDKVEIPVLPGYQMKETQFLIIGICTKCAAVGKE